MVSTLLLVGLAVAGFVGFNIGGSSTGVVWGPPVGAGVTRKTTAAALMTFFVLLGGWTVGRKVIATLGGDLVAGRRSPSRRASSCSGSSASGWPSRTSTASPSPRR
jgi:phosphate/sulfate permease